MDWVHEPKTANMVEFWHLRTSQPQTPGLKLYKDVDLGWIVTYRDWIIDDLMECSLSEAQGEAEKSLRRLLTNDLALLEETRDRITA